ncbi:DUF4105 domain-containing protein [Marinicella sp. W31]|uniref:lipoprotein N-acyltransferase Lnb domain-containing protein n=1 Tax=Marinicella sp. W31 TaxID=3023713 RepID=UPI0037571989
MFKTIKILILLLFCCHAWSQSAEVITIGPGDAYWSAFGHTALKITNQNGQSDMYGFGYFDFTEEDFFINFMYGDMRYFLGVEDASRELNYAAYQERSIHSQPLPLSAAQVLELQAYLENLALPENRQYAYDYFKNNCTSQVRDIVDDLSGGLLQANNQQLTQTSWFDVSFPTPGQGWMNLGLAIGFGWPAYQHRTEWELMSLPQQFFKRLQQGQGIDVQSTDLLYQPKTEELQRNRWINSHYPLILISALLILGLLLPGKIIVAHTWLWIQTLVGLGLLFLWFFTEHSIIRNNFNVLLFMPLAPLLLRHRQLLILLLVMQAVWSLLALWTGAFYLWPFVLVNLLMIRVFWLRNKRA